MSLTVNHLLELKRWILSWGEDAQVLEPDSFFTEYFFWIEVYAYLPITTSGMTKSPPPDVIPACF